MDRTTIGLLRIGSDLCRRRPVPHRLQDSHFHDSRRTTRQPGSPRASPCSSFALGWAVVLAMAAARAGRLPPVEVENVRIGLGRPIRSRSGTWTPVWVQLRAGDERFCGFMESSSPTTTGRRRRSGCRWTWIRGEPGTPPTSAPAPATPSSPSGCLHRGAPGGAAPVADDAAAESPVLMPHEMLILTMGQPQGVEAADAARLPRGGQGADRPGEQSAGRSSWPGIDPQRERFPGVGTVSTRPGRSSWIPVTAR